MKQIAELIEGRPLYHVESTQKVREAARAMTERNIGAIAVLDDHGHLVGVFSERDLMTRVVVPGLDADSTPVSQVMTRDIVVADPGEDVNAALKKMHSLGCRHLPVVEEGKNLVGMISLRDLLQVEGDVIREKASFLRELVTYSPDYET
jgi:CBS domain-containing protein